MLDWRTKNLFFVLFLVFVTHLVSSQNRRSESLAKAPTIESMRAGAFIDINTSSYPESNYSVEQLVKDVLIAGGSTCSSANVSNVVVSPNFGVNNQNRSWGYFNKASTNFPFDKGIVLSTGYAARAGNNFQGTLNDHLHNGVGDIDLATALNLPNSELKDATYIEFDFVPTSTEVSFRYLFASKEYNSDYTCRISDGFALLLKKEGDPSYTNLAVLPNTNIPVVVTNIIPFSLACGPKNEQYFGGLNSPQIQTNFNGRTVPLKAKATVIPGQKYHFKIVLADYRDQNYDSGVFLEAGSFDIGVQILDPYGNTMPSSINMCDNEPKVLTASAVNIPGVTYQWLLGGVPIPGANGVSYTATQPGVYTLQVFIQGNTCPGSAGITIIGGNSPTVQNATLTGCYSSGNTDFNLISAQSSVSTTPGVSYAYYLNESDALAGNSNTIANPASYQSAGGTVYVLVKSGFCSKVAQLQLVKAPQIKASATVSAVLSCTNPQINLDGSSSLYPEGSTFSWTTSGGNIVSGGNTLNPVINAPGIYTLTISKTYQPGDVLCTSVASVTVNGDSAPPTTGLVASKIQICQGESVILTASGGATYVWQNGLTGSGNTQNVTPSTTTTYTVAAVGANGCLSPTPATVTIEVFQPITVQNATIMKCYKEGGIIYDLTSVQSQMTTSAGTAGVTFAYYILQADANVGNANTISTPEAYSSAGNQTIYVLVKRGGCSYVVTLRLLRTEETTLNIAAPQNITCTNTQVTLDASNSVIPAGSVISWSTADGSIVSGANTLQPVVNAAGTYTLTVAHTTQPQNISCSYTQSVTIIEDKVKPITTLTSSHMQICSGESVVLTASGGATYQWEGLSGSGNTQTVSPSSTTVYTVSAVGANGCVSSLPARVTVVVGPPTATLSASKMKICEGESVTLTANGGVTYEWVGLSGNGNIQVVTPTETTLYSVFALGGNGCRVDAPTTITIEVVPAIESTLEDVYVCEGDTGILDAGAGPNYTYVWNTGATTQTISTNTIGTYSVTISNGVCSQVFTAKLLNPDLPKFSNIVFEGGVLTLTATNPTGGVLEYSIDGGVTWQSSNVFHNVLKNANYNIMVKVKNAKCSTALDFYTFSISNVITPNDDGKNDTIDFSGISTYNNFSAAVFNRYGQEIFKASKLDPIWRGSTRGISQPTGTYWYSVQWENPASKKLEIRSGWILLKNRN